MRVLGVLCLGPPNHNTDTEILNTSSWARGRVSPSRCSAQGCHCAHGIRKALPLQAIRVNSKGWVSRIPCRKNLTRPQHLIRMCRREKLEAKNSHGMDGVLGSRLDYKACAINQRRRPVTTPTTASGSAFQCLFHLCVNCDCFRAVEHHLLLGWLSSCSSTRGIKAVRHWKLRRRTRSKR